MAYTALFIPALAIVGQIHAIAIPGFPPRNTSSLMDSLYTASSCDDIHHCRTMWSIVYSCITTIFACTYTSFHPDVPSGDYGRLYSFGLTTCYVIIGFLAPELVVAKALSQFIEVRGRKVPFRGWTRRHSYFAIMGGFVGKGELSLEDMSELDPREYKEMFRDDNPSTETTGAPSPAPSLTPSTTPRGEPDRSKYRILVTKSELKDKSKSNALAIIFAILQTTWFIAQYLERWVARQPRTLLEVMTLAYAVLNILIHGLWFEKPLNVQKPIDVRGRASELADRKANIRSDIMTLNPWEMFSGPVYSALGALGAPGALGPPMVRFGVIMYMALFFGGVHCFAWRFSFPTVTERVLWRVSAVACTVSPSFIIELNPRTSRLRPGITGRWASLVVSVGVYVICRVILVVLTITSLRAMPAGAFQATPWAFFPHFG